MLVQFGEVEERFTVISGVLWPCSATDIEAVLGETYFDPRAVDDVEPFGMTMGKLTAPITVLEVVGCVCGVLLAGTGAPAPEPPPPQAANSKAPAVQVSVETHLTRLMPLLTLFSERKKPISGIGKRFTPFTLGDEQSGPMLPGSLNRRDPGHAG